MSNKECILKLTWGVKSVKNDKLKCMKEYTEKEILNTVNKAVNNDKKGKMDKVEIITSIVDGEEVKYKHYFFDSKTEFTYGECAVNITVKNKNPAKALSFEDKLALLKSWLAKNGVIPKPGAIENDFDVGKFYQQSVTNVDKMNSVVSTVEEYVNLDE